MTNVTHRNDCRLCGSNHLDLVLPILPSAIGDAFIPKELLHEKQETYSLDTYLCLSCGHLQNLDVVNPEILFRNYTYCTSVSLNLVEHFRKYAQDISASLAIAKNSLVVEIGSNDGSLLNAFKNLGMRIQGVDPARNIALTATKSGIPTIPDFFTQAIAQQIVKEQGKASLVCANNVFAHADNIEEIVKGIRALLSDDGVFVFEVSYVPDIINNFVFDTIYHEHVSHHALIPLERFFNRLDMTLFDVARINSKGGSIRGFAQVRSSGKRPQSDSLKQMMEDEKRNGILQPEIYRNFFQDIQKRKEKTLSFLNNAIDQGQTIAAYGASTTTTTLLYHFELSKLISFIIDDNPLKQGMYSPGNKIPVLPSSELKTQRPDVVIILAWIYAEPIIKKNAEYLQAGGKFLVPLPDARVVSEQEVLCL